MRTSRRTLVAAAVVVVLAACSSSSSGGGKGGATSGSGPSPRTAADQGTPDPNGVLRYGQDLTNAMGDDFDPGSLSNGCAYTELSLVMQSVTSPSDTAIEPGVASSWTVDNPLQIT